MKSDTALDRSSTMVANSCGMTYLASLWEEPVTYVVQFAQALQSVTAGYFLSCYIEYYQPDEWVCLNEDIVHKQTGLGRSRWYAVRDTLMAAGILHNERNIHTSRYRLDGVGLERMLQQNSNLALYAITAPPLALNRLHLRTLLNLGLSFKACLYLALVQSETPHTDFRQRAEYSPWVMLSENTVGERTFLSKSEQRRAGEDLFGIGVLQTRYNGFPRIRYCRYSLKRLAELTSDYMQTANTVNTAVG